MFASIFLEFHLPNSTTWFFFSFFLTVALFFQFSRPFSLRNWDLIALFSFVPGFLLLQEANQSAAADPQGGAGERVFGYAWLLSASLYWLVRCFLDLTAVRRPVFRSNLTIPGLAWFGIALFVCLTVVAVRRPADAWEPVGRPPVAVTGVTEGAAVVVAKGEPVDPEHWAELRVWTVRALAMLGHAAVITGLFFVGWRHFRDAETGVAMAAMYLLLPYTAYHISQLHHVLLAALTLWAVFAYRHPRLSGWLLGLAAGSTFFPVLLFPVWLRFYWQRGAWRFTIGFTVALLLSLAATLSVLWAAGYFPQGLSQVMHLADWQPWKRPTAESLWQGRNWAYRLPVFILYAVFVGTSFFWPPVRTMAHVSAMSAALLIGVQFWFADRGGLYVLWYTPLLLLIVFRPAATDLEPPLLAPGRGWGTRLAIGVWNRVRRKSGAAQPPALAA
ncbi:hypothetical protein [Limnoglobus roseus]|uniref:Glycosyltransferase RgtA/B/C/D-like domain-containing protein n=1 Tax=Limnoglobus roseus TaxID=2598579 RepID=A0A5C1AVX7_9BACT|nr:hypothetical protein [Limnoglobus roseus]QEL20958.1 hypothetical protein PX52LOC_08086 [Limnoglobus roseus]